jgi:molybdenum cofactor synthesis domain-containing protein
MPSLIRENREQESAVAENEFIPLNIAVLIVSDSRTEKTDKSGKLLQARLQATGHNMHEKSIVIDDIHQIRAQVALWTANDEVNAILTTGGTGVTGRDGTPEAISVRFPTRKSALRHCNPEPLPESVMPLTSFAYLVLLGPVLQPGTKLFRNNSIFAPGLVI